MKRVTAFTTSDAVLHGSLNEAKRHADSRYGRTLTKHAHALAKAGGKYTGVLAYLDENAGALAELAELKKDRDTLEPQE